MPRELSTVVEEDRESEINLTPMLDVVFIMLIFFIVTASFISETGIDVNSPENARPETHDEANILIVIDKNSDIWIGGRLIDPRAVRANMARLRAENPGGIVVIDADRRSFNNTLVQVMDASRQAGIYEISLAARKK